MGLVTQAVLAFTMGAAMVGADVGHAVRYAEGRMDHVAAVRHIDRQPCMVAWTDATDADIGRRSLLVEGIRTGKRLRCLVVDLPEYTDKPALERRNVLVELDYYSGFVICGAQWQGAAKECRVRVSQ